MKTQKLTTDQLREAHVRMEGQDEKRREILKRIESMLFVDPIMDADDEISRLKARIAELETDNLNLIDQLRGQK